MVDADQAPQAHDSVKVRHRPVQVAAGVVETAANSAGKLVEIKVLAAPATGRALKPRASLLIPQHQHALPVDRNIRCASGEQAPLDLRGRDVFAGLDLSETRDLTALVLISSDIRDGTWHVQPTFWLPSEGLHDKAKSDRVPYDSWATKGFLQTTPGASISYEYVAHHKSVFDQHRVGKIAFDRWNIQHLKPWLLNAGFSEQVIKDKFIGFGQGFKDMSPALRDLESVILERKLRHGDHPILQICASNAVIDRDPAGNRKLSKKRSTGRIDGMTALVMAFGAAAMRTAVQFDPEALIA